ncbi:MAG: M1 family peptidase [Gammaproteobacteria bacterium]|nr:M1 family peptidase [Gammaproteobacteria bacterium]
MSIMKSLRWIVFALAPIAVLAACQPSTTVRDSAPPVGQLGKTVAPTRYGIELSIDPSRDTFSGKVVIDITLKEAQDAIWLHGKNLQVSEVHLTDADSDRIDALYEERQESGVALVTLARNAPAGAAQLHFTYSAPFNTSLNALFKIERDGNYYAATQFEAIAARQAFPGFDEPGFKVPFDLSVIARKGDAVVATTPEASTKELPDGSVMHVFARTRPLPTYLIALAVGPYDVVDYGMIPSNSVRDHGVPLRGIAAKGHGREMQYALKNTAGLLSALETYFGTPYPYEKLDLIAVPETFGGAMENVGAITYDEDLMLMDEHSPLDQRRDYTSTHAHEMSHMWFGNLVTPAWWNDIWLNESFASWIQNKAAHAYWPDGQFDRETLNGALGVMVNDSLASARQIRDPIDNNDKINGVFDGIIYQKGAGVLAMLEHYVGEEPFKAGVRLYLKRHADGTATAEDFIASVATGSDRPEVETAFKSFIEQPGVPLISAKLDCKDDAKPRLDLRQSRYAPLSSSIRPDAGEWTIPICVAYIANGARKSTCALIDKKEQSLNLEAGACPTQVHPNADGTGYYRFTLDEAGWQSLIAGATKLSPAEALIFADSLDAAFRAGSVSAKTYVPGMAALVNHSAWDVVAAATDYLEEVTRIIDPRDLGPAEQAFRAIAAPRYARIVGASDPASRLLQKRLQRFLIVVAMDQAMRKPLARQAARAVGLNGKPDPSAAPASELETVFTVGVQDLGEPFFDLLLKQTIASEDAEFRNSSIGALARVEDPALARKLEAAVLAGKFKGTEMFDVLSQQMSRPATTEQTYAWLKENEKAIIGLIPEYFRSNIFPTFGVAFCSNDRADEWQTFVESHAAELPGYERDLAQTIESIHLCAGLKQASAADLLAAFSSN